MNDLKIAGYGDNLKINDIRLGDLSPKDHEEIELSKGGQNYSPLENVVVSHVKDSSTLICRKPSKDNISKYEKLKKETKVESEIIFFDDKIKEMNTIIEILS